MTKSSRFSKWLLAADLTICSVWLFVVGYLFYDPYLMIFPMLRIWLSFLTYSRSRLAWCPMGLLSVVSVFLLKQYAPIYELWISPLLKIARCILSLFGASRELVTDFMLRQFGQGTFDSRGSQILLWCIGFAWLVGVPLAMYLYRVAHNRLVPSSLSRKQGGWLFAYMLIAITLFGTQFFDALQLPESIAAIILVLLIPVLFRCKSPLLTEAQRTYLLTMALLALGFVFSIGMEDKSIITTLTVPVAIYALINHYVGRKTPRWEYALMAVAMLCFWQAQKTVAGTRIALSVISIIVVAFAAIRFMHATRLYVAGVILFMAIAIIVPVMCIGYNPYTVLTAGRSRPCTDYTASPAGLLYVKSKDGYGIRDRYGIILPAEYDDIKIMLPYCPYFMVRKSDRWRIYDIERHEFITDKSYDEIIQSGVDMFVMGDDKREYILEITVPYDKNHQSFRIIAFEDELMVDENP